MGSNMRTFRSRLNTLPLDMKCELAELSYQIGMRPVSRKETAMEILKYYKVPHQELGTGTNRFIIKFDGYALKMALDQEGVADNRQEWVMAPMLNSVAPGAADAWELSSGGHLLVSSYAPAFSSYNEMLMYQSSIKRILAAWDGRFLLGDVGISGKNFANWGLINNKPVCIDYAYIFPASLELFECICGNKNLKFTDSFFNTYKCPLCGKTYEDSDIRMKISREQRLKMFDNTPGIRLKDAVEEHECDIKYMTVDTHPDAPTLMDFLDPSNVNYFPNMPRYYAR